MKQATLCVLTCLFFGGAGMAFAGAGTFSPIRPSTSTPVRHWDGTLNRITESSLRMVQSEAGPIKIRGKRQRARVRWARWVSGLKADRRTTFNNYGSPPTRYFENYAGRRREVWIYPEHNVQLFFKGDLLTATHIR